MNTNEHKLRLLWDFLTTCGRGRHVRLSILAMGSIVAGGLEALGLAIILPLIGLIVDRKLIYEQPYLHWLFDSLGFESERAFVAAVAVVLFGLFLTKNAFMIGFSWFQHRMVGRWRADIAANLMDGYLAMPYQSHITRSTSELTTILQSRLPVAMGFFLLPAFQLLTFLLVTTCIVTIMLVQLPYPSLIAVAVVAGNMWLQNRILRPFAQEVGEQRQQAQQAHLSVIGQALRSVRETKTMLKEATLSRAYHQASRRLAKYDWRGNFINQTGSYMVESSMILAIMLVCGYVLMVSETGGEGLGSLSLLAAGVLRLAPMANKSLRALSSLNSAQSSMRTILNEIRSLSEMPRENLTDPASRSLEFRERVALREVTYTYPNSRQPALHNVNLELGVGEFVGLVGSSGAGKTTLADILMGLLVPEHGEVTVDGVRLSTDNIRSFRALVGYVPQQPVLLDASLRENVAFGVPLPEIDEQQVERALREAQFTDYRGLDMSLGEGGRNLSGGQKQRVCIARALYGDPEILVLDEATSALDLETESAITATIRHLKGQKTIIAIAHRLSTLRECDRLVFMREGTVVDTGSFGELSQRNPDFERLLELARVTATEGGISSP